MISSSSSSSSLSSSAGTGAGVVAAAVAAVAAAAAFFGAPSRTSPPSAPRLPRGLRGQFRRDRRVLVRAWRRAPGAGLPSGGLRRGGRGGRASLAVAAAGSALADVLGGSGFFAVEGLGLAVTRRAGPSSRFTDAHRTAECLLSRSALGVLGDASNIASVCATHAGGRDLESPPTVASFASTGRTEDVTGTSSSAASRRRAPRAFHEDHLVRVIPAPSSPPRRTSPETTCVATRTESFFDVRQRSLLAWFTGTSNSR